jgi:hypothetical protein
MRECPPSVSFSKDEVPVVVDKFYWVGSLFYFKSVSCVSVDNSPLNSS